MSSIKAEMAERKAQPEIKSAKRWAIAEAVMWTLLLPIYISQKNWLAVILLAVVYSKIYFIYNYRKLFLLTSNLLDEVLNTMKEWVLEADEQAKKKRSKRASTNARTNRKK